MRATESGPASEAADQVGEASRLDETGREPYDILANSAEASPILHDIQRAMINILEDQDSEKQRLEATQRALLNILDDATEEKSRQRDMQSALLNILDDFNVEKHKVDEKVEELRLEVAERTRAEDALRRANSETWEANKELEAFSYSVAHDLRAPLRAIDGFSQALIEDCIEVISEEGKSYIENVREAAQHMARLIDGLLSLSRLSRTELIRSPIDLARIARTVFARLRRDEPDRVVTLTIPNAMPAVADSKFLEIVFENLIGNALKFTGKRPDAQIEVGMIIANGQSVWFVRDNGAGFDMAYAEKLFAVFQRLHTVREFEGTGIGLANVEQIIRRHGGRIWGEGEVDRGATFYFTLEEMA